MAQTTIEVAKIGGGRRIMGSNIRAYDDHSNSHSILISTVFVPTYILTNSK